MNIVYLARHATPDHTRTDLDYRVPPGPPLTPLGEAQARALGAFLQQSDIRMIYSSPLERCWQTARIVGQIVGTPVQVVNGLMEWQAEEDLAAVRARVRPVFDSTSLTGEQIGPVVLVTHGGPILALLIELGVSAEAIDRHRVFDGPNPLPPAGVWQARRDGNGRPWELELVFTPGQ